uniref:Solute carrier family 25 member 32 n=2 Tax=Macrostomum lignano TaxID=282301 RepID=A0A1I8FZI2_9PLAT
FQLTMQSGSSSNGSGSWQRQLLSNVHWENMAAGVAGGLLSTLALHPLDLVKIRFQVDEGVGASGRPSSRPVYRGLMHALSSIYRTQGLTGLYAGVVPNLWGAGASWGLYFLFYEAAKVQLQGGDRTARLPAGHLMGAAAASGAVTLMFTNPIWVCKTRLCLQYGLGSGTSVAAHRYRGMLHALYSIARLEGLPGLYKGYLPGLFGVSHGAIQFLVYEKMKNQYTSAYQLAANAKLPTLVYLGCAALSKIVAAATTYPYQVVRSRLQEQHRESRGALRVCRDLLAVEGWRGFYKGLLPTLLRVTPACCITFVVYEHFATFLMPLRHAT